MDSKQDILLGNQKNIDSVNADNYTTVELTNNVSEINEFTVNDVVNSTEVFDAEREANQVYRIYGRIEWMSLLNGVAMGHNSLEDFFNPIYTGNSKNIINSFDFYLVAPSSGETYSSMSGAKKRRNFEVIATPSQFEIYKAGFSNNVYGEQVYEFSFKTDFDVSEYYDKLGFPLTELFLYAQYIESSVIVEQMSRTTWSYSGVEDKVDLTTKDLNIGDTVEHHQGSNIQDVIEYREDEYYQAQVEPQTFYIRTRYNDSGPKWLEWSYNPFIPFRLRYLDGVVSTAPLPEIVENTSTFSVELIGAPATNFTATKSLKKSLTTSLRTINKWDEQYSSNYYWNYNTGTLLFFMSGTYEVNFQTEIRLTQLSDKYIAETYLEESTGYSWDEIPDTRRKYQISSPIQGVKFTKSFNNNGGIRMKTRLIPNPEERKVFRIPDYAKMIEVDGKYVWRDILPQGYTDPITNLGVDYPFFNDVL